MKMPALLIFLFIAGCGFSSRKKEDVAPSVSSDEVEFSVDTLEPANTSEIKVTEQKVAETKMPDELVSNNDQFVKSDAELKHESKELELVAPSEPKFEDYKKDSPSNIPVITATEESRSDLRKQAEYHLQKNETLMMVAFKIYGDYRKWKDLKSWNKGISYKEGSVLKYYLPEKDNGWQPEGLPYLVKTGDSLQIISKDKYGTVKKWKSIYDNNKPLIRDPNLIFAGFTIYYIPTRDIASKIR